MESKPQTVSIDSLEIDLGQYWLILKRRFLPAVGVFSLILLGAMLLSSLQKPSYQVQGKLLLKVDRVASLTGVGTELGEFSPLTMQSSPLKTETEVLLSTPLLEQTITRLDLRDEAGKLLKPKDLREQLEVKPVTGADVLQVNFKGDNPETAAAIINQLMQVYVENNVLMSRKQASEARQVIAEQLPRAEVELRQADVNLRRFKEANGVTNLDEESSALVSSASQLNNELTKTQQALADANARLAALQSKVGISSDAALELSALSQSPGVQKALQDLQEVQNQLATERSRYEDQYPTVVNLREKEALLRQILQDRVSERLGRAGVVPEGQLQIGSTEQDLIQQLVATEIQRLGLVNQIDALNNTRTLYQQRSAAMPALEQQLGDLQQQLDLARSTYQNLVKTYQEVQIAEQQKAGNANILEKASVPDQPTGNKKKLLQILGVMVGLLGALSTIILLELIDRSVKTSQEAQRLLPYPYLGLIPAAEKRQVVRTARFDAHGFELPPEHNADPAIGAAYRLLQANLKFAHAGRVLKVIVVTSSVADEGKSAVAANLAATIAQLGRRVLLIDADLYNPQQHELWHLRNTLGLSDVVIKQVDVKVAVQPLMDHLDILTAGSVVSNPLAVLDSASMQNVLTQAAQRYDFVILDASPVTVEAEALTLGQITDGLMLVVRPGVLDSARAKRVHELLQQSGQTVLGIVVNEATSQPEPTQLLTSFQPNPQLPGISREVQPR